MIALYHLDSRLHYLFDHSLQPIIDHSSMGGVVFVLLVFTLVFQLCASLKICEGFKVPPPGTSVETLEEWESADRKLFDYMESIVPEALTHTGSTAFDSHLKGVQAILRRWNRSSSVCNAGLFHSIYGTEGFQGFKLPLSHRPTIRKLIGEQAERLVWIFCMVDRLTLDNTLHMFDDEPLQKKPSFELLARPELGRFPIPLKDENEWLDFIELTLADWLEQVEGAAERANPLFEWQKGEAWSYRRRAYAKMADVLVSRRGLTIAKETLETIYAMEPEATRHLVQEVTPPMSVAAREAREAIECIHL